MAVVDYSPYPYIRCLSGDTKPTKADGWELVETDTGKEFIRSGGAWVAYQDVSPTHSCIGTGHTFPGGTTNFLRADGTWNAPAGGSNAFPVGSVFLAVVATDPATLLGYGTWVQISQGKFLVGQDAGDVAFGFECFFRVLDGDENRVS